jgi:hypothetical protein
MSSLAPIIMSVFGGGAVTGAVTAGRWLMDERARRRAEKAATVRAPLVQKSLELRVAAQADEILQETIKTLRENYSELKKHFAQYRIDTDELRSATSRSTSGSGRKTIRSSSGSARRSTIRAPPSRS